MGIPNPHPNKLSRLSSTMSIADLLKAWPQTTQVFFRHRMACVGCSMAAFDTIEDAQKNYCLDLNTFLDELDQARQGSKNY